VSLTREVMIELMALADGELEGPARERAEKLVAENVEARRVVDAMRAPAVAMWLGDAMQERAVAAGADGVADAVMAKIAAPAAAGNGYAAVDGAGAPGEPREEGGVVRLSLARAGARRWSRLQVGAAALSGALALAAGVAFVLRSADHKEMGWAPVASVVAPSQTGGRDVAPSGTAVAQLKAPPSQGVEVDEIDSPSRGVSVFEIPLGSVAAAASPVALSSVVIWIDDDPGAGK
jgi:hypothetical protein